MKHSQSTQPALQTHQGSRSSCGLCQMTRCPELSCPLPEGPISAQELFDKHFDQPQVDSIDILTDHEDPKISSKNSLKTRCAWCSTCTSTSLAAQSHPSWRHRSLLSFGGELGELADLRDDDWRKLFRELVA